MNKLPQPSPKLIGEAISKFLIPALQKQGKKKDNTTKEDKK